jgi:uncharacterized protein (TIGR02266 family)
MPRRTVPRRTTRRFRRRTLRVFVEYLADTGPCCDPATTLGAGGLFIETESPQREGTPLKLRFRLPDSPTTHEIEGRVAWARGPQAPGSYAPGMGIEFTDRNAAAALARELAALDEEEPE